MVLLDFLLLLPPPYFDLAISARACIHYSLVYDTSAYYTDLYIVASYT